MLLRTRLTGPMLAVLVAVSTLAGACDSGDDAAATAPGASSAPAGSSAPPPTGTATTSAPVVDPASEFTIRSFHPRWSADLDAPVDARAGTIPRITGNGAWRFEGALSGDGTVVSGVIADPRQRDSQVTGAANATLRGQASISLVMLRGRADGCGEGTAVLWFYGDPAEQSRWGVVPGFGAGGLAHLGVDDATLSLTETGGTLGGALRCDDTATYLRIDHHPLFTAEPGPVTVRRQTEFCYLLPDCEASGTGIFVVPWQTYFDDETGPILADHPHGVVPRAVGYWTGDGTTGVYVSMASPGSLLDDGNIGMTLVWSTAPVEHCGRGSYVLLQRTRAVRLGDIIDSVDEIVPGLGTGEQASITGDGVENGWQHAPPDGGRWWSDLALHCDG